MNENMHETSNLYSNFNAKSFCKTSIKNLLKRDPLVICLIRQASDASLASKREDCQKRNFEIDNKGYIYVFCDISARLQESILLTLFLTGFSTI